MKADALPPAAVAIDKARDHALFRFSAGITAAFVLAETMGWSPTFLEPVLTGVLLANLPVSPPFKVGVVLVAVMALAATLAFLLSSLLLGSPTILTGCIGLVIFLALYTMARGKAVLPAMLLLLCMATVPVIAMAAPPHAGVLPIAFVRGMAVAILIVWGVHAIWPEVAPPVAKPPAAAAASPSRTALVGTAIIMPLMLAYMLLGLTDALLVLITTVILVATLDVRQGAMQGLARALANLFGGLIGLLAFLLVGLSPSLPVLALLTFLIAVTAASGLARGGAVAGVALLTCNTSLIVLSTALASPDSSAGIWLTRLFQLGLAWLFAVGMMSLAWPRQQRA